MTRILGEFFIGLAFPPMQTDQPYAVCIVCGELFTSVELDQYEPRCRECEAARRVMDAARMRAAALATGAALGVFPAPSFS